MASYMVPNPIHILLDNGLDHQDDLGKMAMALASGSDSENIGKKPK